MSSIACPLCSQRQVARLACQAVRGKEHASDPEAWHPTQGCAQIWSCYFAHRKNFKKICGGYFPARPGVGGNPSSYATRFARANGTAGPIVEAPSKCVTHHLSHPNRRFLSAVGRATCCTRNLDPFVPRATSSTPYKESLPPVNTPWPASPSKQIENHRRILNFVEFSAKESTSVEGQRQTSKGNGKISKRIEGLLTRTAFI